MMDEKTHKKKKGAKNQKTRRETAVQGTNDNSIVSKCSMAATGYVEDNYLKFFVAKTSRRAPLIHWGYYIRTKTVSSIVQNFLQRYAATYKQILSLGAGFDSAFFRLKTTGVLQNAAYVEVDFPDVVKRKNAIIQSTPELKGLLGQKLQPNGNTPHIELCHVDFRMLGVDLTQWNTLEAALRMCHVDFEAPTLILSECVLTYMTRRCASAVIKWSAETFPDSMFVLYEQIHPEDAFGLFMQNHYNVIGSPLKCINSFPTLESQKDRFLSLGWNWCEGYDMNQFYKDLVSTDEKRYISGLEPFDEFEEWHLKCAHYFVLCAYSKECPSLLESGSEKGGKGESSEKGPTSDSVKDLVLILPASVKDKMKRFSHVSARLNNGIVITLGGFGEQDGRHQRICDIHVLDPITLKQTSMRLSNNTELSRMHHNAIVLEDDSILVIGGRNSPYRLCSKLISLSLSKKSEDNHTYCDTVSGNGEIVDEGSSERKSTSLSVANGKGMKDQPMNEDVSHNDENSQDPSFKFDVNLEEREQIGDIPCSRWRHASAHINIGGDEVILLYGGRTSSEPSLEDAYLYTITTNEWTKLVCDGDSPGCRQSHTLVTWGQKAVLCGGLDHNLLPQDSIYSLDLPSKTWHRLEIHGTFHARYSHSCHVLNDTLVVIGGVNLEPGSPGVALVDLKSGKCQEYALPPADKDRLIMIHKQSSVDLGDQKFLITGGGGNCFSFGSHLNASPFIIDISLCYQHFKAKIL